MFLVWNVDSRGGLHRIVRTCVGTGGRCSVSGWEHVHPKIPHPLSVVFFAWPHLPCPFLTRACHDFHRERSTIPENTSIVWNRTSTQRVKGYWHGSYWFCAYRESEPVIDAVCTAGGWLSLFLRFSWRLWSRRQIFQHVIRWRRTLIMSSESFHIATWLCDARECAMASTIVKLLSTPISAQSRTMTCDILGSCLLCTNLWIRTSYGRSVYWCTCIPNMRLISFAFLHSASSLWSPFCWHVSTLFVFFLCTAFTWLSLFLVIFSRLPVTFLSFSKL